jgi:hypothetical protein
MMPAVAPSPSLSLSVLPGRFAVCRLDPAAPVPAWAWTGALVSVSRTAQELSVVCDEAAVPPGVRHQPGWSCLVLEGTFDFALTGILAAVLIPLRDAGIGIFAVSTFDTDAVLVPADRLDAACAALGAAGHRIAAPAPAPAPAPAATRPPGDGRSP